MTADTKTRDERGRWKKGQSPNPAGRPKGRGLVDVLREMTDPEELAEQLLKRAKTSDAVLMYVYDRLEGRPKQSSEVEHIGKVDVSLAWSDGAPA